MNKNNLCFSMAVNQTSSNDYFMNNTNIQDDLSLFQSQVIKNDTKDKLNLIESIISEQKELIQSQAINRNDYLIPREIHEVEENTFKEKCLLKFDQESINQLKQQFDLLQLSNDSCDDQILFNTVGMINLYANDNKNFIWRRIKGDGNCFYRAVIFTYLENIILTSNKQALCNFIYDFSIKINIKEFVKLTTDFTIDINFCLRCFVMLYYSMISKSRDNIMKTYVYFLKIMNNYRDVDYGLISYYHILIYDYLKENQLKFYSTEFSVLLSNLLPSQYEDEEGNIHWQRFYEEFLFKLYREAEKIVIYITPYLFSVNLDVLYYDGKDNYNGNILFPLPQTYTPFYTLSVLYEKVHYNIIYYDHFFTQYKKYLSINFFEIKNNHCFRCQTKKELLNVTKMALCHNCLTLEIKSVILSSFLSCIQNNFQFFLSKFYSIDNIRSEKINLTNKLSFTVEEGLIALKNENAFNELLAEIKANLCLICNKPLDNKKNEIIILPCNCCLCSANCLKSYYSFIETTSRPKNNCLCLCNTSYSPNQIIKAIILFEFYSFKCDSLMNVVYRKTRRTCFLCMETIQFIKGGFIIQYQVKNHKLKHSTLNHTICDQCFLITRNHQLETIYHCMICDDNNKLIDYKQKPNDFAYEEY